MTSTQLRLLEACMHLFLLGLLCAISCVSLQGSEGSCRGQAHNDLLPLLRCEASPRFFEDEGAMLFLGEFGELQNRVNASIAFACADEHYLKFGGEVLNEQLTYSFPFKHGHRWMRQYAGAASYLMAFDLWGFRGLEIKGQISNVQRRNVNIYFPKGDRKGHHHDHEWVYQRAIAASKGYAASVGLEFSPYCWFSLKVAAVYDKVEYNLKYTHRKIVQGIGGTVSFEQQLSPTISVELKGELRKPYSYYEGRILWKTLLCDTDITLGAFGGHTVGKHRLPNSTVAGVEIGFDFGVNGFSGLSSVRLCDDSSSHQGFLGQDIRYMKWLASPAVYVPEVLAISEQRQARYSDVRREHHHHHHRRHKYDDANCGCHSNQGVNIPDSRREIRAQQLQQQREGMNPFIDQYPDPDY